MNIHERNTDFGDINKEIQKLLSSNEIKPTVTSSYTKSADTDILTLLESLNRTYNEINAALRTENSEALKDVILKSDIKMNMACETLLNTLRSNIAEKNELIKENQSLEKLKRDHESKEFTYKLAIEKLKSDAEFKKTSLEELNRIIHDQKSRMAEFKEEAMKCKNDVNFYKAKIDELENLRSRAGERLSVFEKELDALNFVIKEKDERILALVTEKKSEEDKNLNIKTRMAELESMNDVLNKKMDVKDKNLALCNSELSKVLCENKRLKVDFEKFKESSTYYEGLYKSLSTQNNYLNSQLNKMLSNAEYNKDIDGFVTKYKSKLKKAANKIKKLKFQLQEYEEARSLLPDDTTDSLTKKLSETSIKNESYKRQIEELMHDKKLLEDKIKQESKIKSNLSEIKSSAGRGQIKNLESNNNDNDRDTKEEWSSFKQDNSYKYQPKYSTYETSKTDNEISQGALTNYNKYQEYQRNNLLSNDEIFNRQDNRNTLRSNIQNYFSQKDALKDAVKTDKLQPEALYHNYLPDQDTVQYNIRRERDLLEPNYKSKVNGLYERYSLDDKVKAQSNFNNLETKFHSSGRPVENVDFIKSNYDNYGTANNTYMKLFNLENNYDEKADQLKDSLVGGMVDDVDVPESKLSLKYSTDKNNRIDNEQFLYKASNNGNLSSNTKNPPLNPSRASIPISKDAEDNISIESLKTVHTSSTLKEMLARTETLQKKFTDLENKLADINEGESVDKLTDKIKTYNSYYSDWNVDSNDSDYM